MPSPQMQERFVSLGQEVVAAPPEQLAEYARRDNARYSALIREINLQPEGTRGRPLMNGIKT